ncbi:MAG: AmmeMemoRadiSam system protein A [Melioribacteraceae bacterium]|nr:AmmeMemoRadiSam system protein A [Melioribacteraceae bacterium]
MNLTHEEKTILLSAARSSIESIFSKMKVETPDYEKYPSLKINAGAFVTLTEYNSLRGCIGYIISDQPLFDTVCDAAIQAAIHDPRFPRLSESELPNIKIEISVLSPPFKMHSYDEIVIGKHGLILEENSARGLLLPQVPIEHNMNRDQFLDAICKKSGLPKKYWQTKQLKLKGFTAEVFSEEIILGE